MAYNKINFYKKIIEIQELTYKLYHTKEMYYKEIYWQHIYPKYHISYRTYHNYLGIPAKRELKKITGEDTTEPSPNLFSDCPHTYTVKKVIKANANCETTAEFCFDCGLQLTQPKTDC